MVLAPEAAALEAALATWRRTGDSEHASVVEARARRALDSWTPPTSDSTNTFQRAWLSAVRDVVGRGWAIHTLFEQLPGADPVQRAGALAKRIEALARHGPDPRFLLATSGIAVLNNIVLAPRLVSAARRLEAGAHVVPTVSVTRELPPATPEVEALWRTVHANPDDDGALSVLADALQLAGDPRGELIALQLIDGDDDPARAARRKALIENCGAAWLGGLAPITGAASFERGVLRRWQVSSKRTSDHRSWPALLADPALATVTDLLPGDVEDRVYARFIASPAMRSLTRIEAHSTVEPLRDLPPLPPSITHLACPTASVADVTRALPSDSQLRSIAIVDSEIDALLAARWFPRLDAVTLAGNVRRNLARWPVLPRPMTLTLAPSASLPPCTTTFPWDHGITLRREGDATIAQISGAWLLLPIEVLSALPEDTARIEVDHTSAALIDRLRGALARPAIDIVQRSASRLGAVFVPATRR